MATAVKFATTYGQGSRHNNNRTENDRRWSYNSTTHGAGGAGGGLMTARAIVANAASTAPLHLTVLLDRADDVLVCAHARRVASAQMYQIRL